MALASQSVLLFGLLRGLNDPKTLIGRRVRIDSPVDPANLTDHALMPRSTGGPFCSNVSARMC